MIRIQGWVLIAAISVVSSLSGADTTVKVRLVKSAQVVELSGLGLQVASQRDLPTPANLPRLVKASVQVVGRRAEGTLWQVTYPESGRKDRFLGERLFVQGDLIRLGIEPIPQALELQAVEGRRIDVISPLDIENYLLGVLPSEMPASWSLEALKAQAVASRSYALSMMRSRKGHDFHVESTVFDQVYRLTNQIGTSNVTQLKIARAIRETSGQVLTDDRGAIIRAHYHADCGGRTELARNVWGDQEVAGYGVVQEPLCPQSPWAHWEYLVSRNLLHQWLSDFFGMSARAALKSVAIAGRTPSGRVSELDVVFEGAPLQRIRSHDFRRILGFSNVKSTNFNIRWRGSDMVIDGKGNGHGVGMCQYGARHLAERGLSYQDILRNYFPKAKLVNSRPPNGEAPQLVKAESPGQVL